MTEQSGKRLTINDIARLAGVSKKTVSRVINKSPSVKEDTRTKIEAVIAEHGFAPDPHARGLAFRRAFLVALIYDNPSPQYIVSMQQGILNGLAGSGLELVVRPANRADADFLDQMRLFIERQKLSGVVLPPSISEDERLAALLKELDCPYVRIASVPMDDSEHMLVTHDARGAAEAAGHLARLGHTRIAFISGPPTFRSSHERRAGFAAGLHAHGLSLDPTLSREGAYTFESGELCANALLDLPEPPTAIFAGNDEMALGVYAAVRKRGLRIPDALSVVGFDDSPMAARIWPGLTSVRLPILDMGQMAAGRLLELNGEDADAPLPPLEVLPALVERASTAAPTR